MTGMILFCALIIWAFTAGLSWTLADPDEEDGQPQDNPSSERLNNDEMKKLNALPSEARE